MKRKRHLARQFSRAGGGGGNEDDRESIFLSVSYAQG